MRQAEAKAREAAEELQSQRLQELDDDVVMDEKVARHPPERDAKDGERSHDSVLLEQRRLYRVDARYQQRTAGRLVVLANESSGCEGSPAIKTVVADAIMDLESTLALFPTYKMASLKADG